MVQLDDNFLISLGFGDMPQDQRKAFLQHTYEELELRVGTKLSEGMTDDQLKEFEKLVNAGDEAGSLKWLETNRPNYKDVVAGELEKIKAEIVSNKEQILGKA